MSIRADVDRALAIIQQIEKLEAELKDIETRLKIAGYRAGELGEHEDLKDEDREGRRWFARGSEQRVPVIFTADKVLGEFKRDSERHLEILNSIPETPRLLTVFFKPVNKFENRYRDGKAFRAAATELLNAKAPVFITACLARDKNGIAKTDVKIDWHHPEPAGRRK